MNLTIWILQSLLAGMFLLAGLYKLFTPKVKLEENMFWVEDYSSGTIKFISIAEIFGALGVILPLAFNIVPILTPVAAFALAVVMLLATRIHANRNRLVIKGI
jgi:uncharacterized membrane protein YphA (DoxX/SURF4 family)